MKYRSIPQMTRSANYTVTIEWDYLEHWINDKANDYGDKFQMDPEFQRGHVWDEDRQIKYVEYILRGGKSSRTIQWNCAGWMNDFKGPIYLVDGKQRVEAVRRFLKNEIPAFGCFFKDFEDRIPHEASFIFCVNDLKTYKEVLQWYIELNDGGIVHTPEELQKVRDLISKA